METNRGDRPLERRYRVKPIRLAASVLLLCLVVGAAIVLPRNLGFLLRVPAPSPLGADGAAGFTAVTTVQYAGRCLAMRVAPDGTAHAAALDGNGLTVYSAFADGSHLESRCSLGGEIGPVAFLPSGHIVVWTTERTAGGGGTLFGFGPLTKTAMAKAPLVAAWTCRLDKAGAGLVPLPEGSGVCAVWASNDGVPSGCVIVSAAGKKGASIDLADGVYTAWHVAGATGAVALGGAEYSGGKTPLVPFVRAYSPDGSRLMASGVDGTPPLEIAVSATGSHLLYASANRLAMLDNKGEVLWSRRVAGDAVRSLHVFPDGRSFLAGPDAGISLDDRGHVLKRWGLTGLGPVSLPGPAANAILSLPGGAVAIDSTGKVVAQALFDGPSQMICADTTAQWLFRADGAALTLLKRG